MLHKIKTIIITDINKQPNSIPTIKSITTSNLKYKIYLRFHIKIK